MTIAQNNIVKDIRMFSMIDASSPVMGATSDINQGDLCYYNSVTKAIEPITADAHVEFLLGVSRVTVVDGKYKSPYIGTAVDASQAKSAVPGPVAGVVAFFTMKTGDTFLPLCKVYYGGDSQTVSSVDAEADGLYLGIYQGKETTAVAGQKGEFLVGARYGLGTLQILF